MTTATANGRRTTPLPGLGSFVSRREPAFSPEAVLARAGRFREACFVVRDARTGHVGVAFADEGEVAWGGEGPYPVVACLPPVCPEWLGDRSFNEAHGVRFPY